MQITRAPRFVGFLALGIMIALAIVALVPTPLALLLALIALPVEALLLAAATHCPAEPIAGVQRIR